MVNDIGFILFNGHLYTPATSPLLLSLIEALLIGGRVNNLNYLAFGFHTTPMHILLTRPWPRGTLLSARVTFFDNMGCQCMIANDNDNVIININGVDFMFVKMLLTNTSYACTFYHLSLSAQLHPPKLRQSDMGFGATSTGHASL